MTTREREYVEELQAKIAKFEEFLNEALEGPFTTGAIGGGGYTDIIREVPFDSPLNNGDRITKLERGDREA